MKTILKNLVLVFVLGLLVSACKVYTIPVDSFSDQIAKAQPEKKRMQVGGVFYYVRDSIYTNGVRTLLCYNNNSSLNIQLTFMQQSLQI